MAELIHVIQQIAQNTVKSMGITDLVVGTVTGVSPLNISISRQMPALGSEVLELTSGVVEKKLPLPAHTHAVPGASHSHSVPGLSHTHRVELPEPGGTAGDAGAHTKLETSEALTGAAVTSAFAGPEQQTREALSGLCVVEHGKKLPVRDGYLILNRGLETGDKVLLLSVCGGQRYLVLSRVMT